MRKIAKPLSIIILVVGIMAMSGCGGLSAEERTEIALKSRYNEEFVVHTIDATSWGGGRFAAYVSPVNNPDVVFETMMNDQGWDGDNYAECYTAALINDILKEDLEDFFPGAYIRTEVKRMKQEEEILDFGEMSLEDMIINSQGIGEMFVDIYYDKGVGTKKDYGGEYKFFSDSINENINQNKMFPTIVSIYKVDSSAIVKLEEYFKKDTRWTGDFERNILGTDDYKLGICTAEEENLGSPSNIAVCFIYDAPTYNFFDEYCRKRELLENAE